MQTSTLRSQRLGMASPRMPAKAVGLPALSRRKVAPIVCQSSMNDPLPSNPPPAAPPMPGPYMLPQSEAYRKYSRDVFDFPQWIKHRDNLRYATRLWRIPSSTILRRIVPSVSWVLFCASLVCTYTAAKEGGMLPEVFPALEPNPACSAFVDKTSVALSLLLVFRTNSSYGRWDEARKMWGGLLNRSRDIMRQAATCFPADPQGKAAKEAMARWTIAFARALRIHFQPEVTLQGELEKILKPEELKMLAAAQHKPVCAIHSISQIIQSVPISSIHQYQMSQNLTFFHDVLGGCERLLRAPIPVSYTRHTARFLFLWLSLLPFALYPTTGWTCIPLSGAIAAVLAGIEEIGVQCEEPFGILPLEVIAGRIEADVRATFKDDDNMRDLLMKSTYGDLLDKDDPYLPEENGKVAVGSRGISINPQMSRN